MTIVSHLGWILYSMGFVGGFRVVIFGFRILVDIGSIESLMEIELLLAFELAEIELKLFIALE